MKKYLLLMTICIITTISYNGLLYAGGFMKNAKDSVFYKKLCELEKKKEWKMVTERSVRVEPSFKETFVICSFDVGQSKSLDISLFKPPEWASKNLGSYALSPNGLEIAFVMNENDATFNSLNSLYLLNIKTGEINNVLPPQQFPKIGNICYLPDGKSILFVGKLKPIEETANIPQFNSLYKLNLQTKSIDELVKYKVYTINTQSCSPDGNKIVYENSNFDEIYIYELANNKSYKLVDGKYPTWAPNGESIAYCGKDGNYYLIDLNTSNKKLLIPKKSKHNFKPLGETIGDISGELLWSPDGHYVYYQKTASRLLADVEHYVPYVRDIATQEEIRLPNDLEAIKSWVGEK